MKKLTLLSTLVLTLAVSTFAQQYEYKIVTTIESIVPMGVGRSRIIEHNQPLNYEEFTTTRIDGKDSKQGKVKRGDAKIDNLSETKILNFYSGVGINFQNVASNDAMISDVLTKMSAKGWDLFTVVSGVESKGSKDDNQGIFITRFVFRKKK